MRRVFFDCHAIVKQNGGDEYFGIAAFGGLNGLGVLPDSKQVRAIVRTIIVLDRMGQELSCQFLEGLKVSRQW